MVLWTFIICVIIGCVFLFVIFYGAPYLPTKRSRVNGAIDMLNLQPGQLLLELGSGDGRLLRAAATRGIRSIGYELNPILVWYSRLVTLRYRHLVTVRCANYWNQPLPPCDAVYVFLLSPYMAKMDAKLLRELKKPVNVLSFAFEFPGRTPVTQVDGMLLYKLS